MGHKESSEREQALSTCVSFFKDNFQRVAKPTQYQGQAPLPVPAPDPGPLVHPEEQLVVAW